MRHYLALITIQLFVLIQVKAAPDGIIRGRVFDKSSGLGLSGATIILQHKSGTITNEDGWFELQKLSGKISLTFQYIGYKSAIRNVQLLNNDTITLEIGMENEVAEIDQVVISASRNEQRIAELTISMSLVKPEYMANSHISDAQELINKTSGIEVLDGQASIRGGSGFSYGAGSRVLALVDGLPIMTADAGNIRWQFLPLDNISQIEIIKGASSVIYGSSALNGIINFRTADASIHPETKFYVETGIFDRPSNKDWLWWNTPRIFSSGSFSHLQRFGNTDIGAGLYLVNDNGYRRLNDEQLGRVNFKLKHRSKNVEGLVFGLNLNGGITQQTDFVLWENAATGALKQNEETAIQLNSNIFNIDPFLSFRKNDRIKHELRGRMSSSKNSFPNSAQNNSHATNFYAEYQFWNKLSEKFALNAGLSENYSIVNSNFYNDHKAFNFGAYTQMEIKPSERLNIVSGVRVEQNLLDGTADRMVPLFRAGTNYRVLDYTFIRASFGQGYRFPSIAEKHATTTLGSIKIYPSQYVESEKGWNSEIGIKQGFGNRHFKGQLDLAFFYSQYNNMIEYLFGIYPDPLNGEFGYGFKATNIEAARVYGLELEYTILKTLGKVSNTLTGGYVFMYPSEYNVYTKKNTGDMLKYRRKHSVTINLSSAYQKFDFGFSLFIKSKILRIDDVFLSELTRESFLPGFYDYWNSHNTGYFLADVQLGYAIARNYKLSFVVKNIGNTEYMGRPGDIQPQRNFSVRLSGNF